MTSSFSSSPTSANTRPPEWSRDGDQGFASSVMKGVEASHDGLVGMVNTTRKVRRRKPVDIDELAAGVRAGNRTLLGRAISLVESNATRHMDQGQKLLQQLLPETGGAIRIGITGVPGAGKSTFVDAFGSWLCDQGKRVAVLAVDPSSAVTKGSILGDKTRMETLSRNESAFIRPSPSGGTLGGVNRKTRETLLLCEAAGFDIILIETVGVGQSEATVRSMSDFFLLVTLTGAGDELQSIKRGVMENADAMLVNKADGENKLPAQRLASELNSALHYLRSPTPEWSPRAHVASSLEKTGLDNIWSVIDRFVEITRQSGFFQQRRDNQVKDWMMSMVLEQLQQQFLGRDDVQSLLPTLENAVVRGSMPATTAARQLLACGVNPNEANY